MALKTTQRQLKKKFRAEIKKLKTAIKLHCCECMGWMVDGVYDCGITDCPLYPYRLKTGPKRWSEEFTKLVAEYRKKREGK